MLQALVDPTSTPMGTTENQQGKKKAMAGSKAATQQDRISGPPQQVKGKPSAKANKDSDPQKAGKGTWEIKSADSKSSPSELDGDDVIGDKDAAKQLQKGHLSS
jgi:hypothetical protein